MKTLDKLCLFGGKPAFERKLHVGCPNIGNREKFLFTVNNILDSKWLTNNGQYVQEFEKQLAGYLGVKHCIVTSNGTIALEIAIKALELSGEIIVPSFTFIATVHAIYWQRIKPIFCDIRKDNYTIDPNLIEKLITPKTTGIIGTNIWGNVCNTNSIKQIAKDNNLKVIYDSAHAFSCTNDGKMIGCFGDAEIFSFHATKFLNSLEGGAITTNNDELAWKVRRMKNFGFAGYDKVDYIGTNGKMNEVSAAMGLANLEVIKEVIEHNFSNYKHYKKHLNDIPGIKFMEYKQNEENNYQYIVVEIDEEITGLSRDTIMLILHGENIIARRYFYPGAHNMEPYKTIYRGANLLLPYTENICKKTLLLPTGMSIQPKDIDTICDTIIFIVKNAAEIKDRLNKLI